MQTVLDGIGWALLYSIAPIAAVGLVVCLLLTAPASFGPAVRYKIAASSLMLSFAIFCTIMAMQLVSNSVVNSSVISSFSRLTDTASSGVTEFHWAFDAATFAIIWLIWVFVMTGRLCMQHLRAVQSLKTASLADSRTRETVVQLASALAMPEPVTRVSENTNSPYVCGLVRPTIVLPTDFFDRMDSNAANAVLRHELQHIRRRDVVASFLQSLLSNLMYFHPAIIMLNRTMDLEREKICDFGAAFCLQERKALVRGLADLAAFENANPSPGYAVAHAIGGQGALIQRVALLSGEHTSKVFARRNKLRTIQLMTMLLICGLASYGAAVTASAARPAPKTDARIADTNFSRTAQAEVRFNGQDASAGFVANRPQPERAIDEVLETDRSAQSVQSQTNTRETELNDMREPKGEHDPRSNERDRTHSQRDGSKRAELRARETAHEERDRAHRQRDEAHVRRDDV